MGILRLSVGESMRLQSAFVPPVSCRNWAKKRARTVASLKTENRAGIIGSHPAFKPISNWLQRCEFATHHAAQAEQTRTQQGQRTRLRNCGE